MHNTGMSYIYINFKKCKYLWKYWLTNSALPKYCLQHKTSKKSFDKCDFYDTKDILVAQKVLNSNIWYSTHHVLRTRKSLAHHEGTALMWLSNPFLVDNLLKIVWFQLTISDIVKSWLAHKIWLMVKAVVIHMFW